MNKNGGFTKVGNSNNMLQQNIAQNILFVFYLNVLNFIIFFI